VGVKHPERSVEHGEAQQEKAAEIFMSASRLKLLLLCPQPVIIEFVYVLEKIYHQPKKHIQQLAADLLALPGIEVIHEINFYQVLTFWPDHLADFGDALVATAAKMRKEAQVATFDKKLINSLKKFGIRTIHFS